MMGSVLVDVIHPQPNFFKFVQHIPDKWKKVVSMSGQL